MLIVMFFFSKLSFPARAKVSFIILEIKDLLIPLPTRSFNSRINFIKNIAQRSRTNLSQHAKSTFWVLPRFGYFNSSSTIFLTKFPSAWPLSFPMAAPITFPISDLDVAPSEEMISFTCALVSDSSICSGR